jgi:hypothetical protein
MSASHLDARAVCRGNIAVRRLGFLPALIVTTAGVLSFEPPFGGRAFAATDVPRDNNPVAAGHALPAAAAPDAQRLPVIGLGADAGLPDGLVGSLVLRPSELVRVQVGAGSNTASPGIRAGGTFLPLGAGPSLTLEGGYYLAGDAGGIVRTFFSGIGRFSEYVGKVSYAYANFHTGLDFGRKDFTFFIHGGVTYMRATLSELDVPPEAARLTSSDGQTTTISFREDPVLRMWTPSVKLGLVFYLQ